jgi:poly-gamma-glutamate capsule biosynthesis protein CapA/YwtB (metallophosphatase superfamily)
MKLVLTGDVNLMNVNDPAVPFARVAGELRSAGVVFSNLECCLFDPGGYSVHGEGFYAHSGPGGEALKAAGIRAVGIANNVNYGEAAIEASIARLDALGIAHTGAGRDLATARAPAIVTGEVTCGFLQRSSVYWPTNHEAGNAATGIAVMRGHTAYHVPMHKTRPEIPPPNRPGVPPDIVTWADAAYLRSFADDIAALRARADIIVASCHWGLGQEVLAYMTQIAHAAIDAGADIVMGHGPHYSLPVEAYKGRPIFYGLGSFSFLTGHGGRQHGDWLGMMVRAAVERDGLKRTTFQFVRHNARNETVLCALADERAAFEGLAKRSEAMGAKLSACGDEILVEPAG